MIASPPARSVGIHRQSSHTTDRDTTAASACETITTEITAKHLITFAPNNTFFRHTISQSITCRSYILQRHCLSADVYSNGIPHTNRQLDMRGPTTTNTLYIGRRVALFISLFYVTGSHYNTENVCSIQRPSATSS